MPLSTITPPAAGILYHGVYPGGTTGEEDDITVEGISSYEKSAGKRVAWVYFSNNWFNGRTFPLATASMIRQTGAVPFIRLMMRSSAEGNSEERTYTLQNIIDGRFDRDLTAWGKSARDFASPILVEYGTECNGYWFSWNGKWNGGGTTTGFGDPAKADGPERFVAAYRHIVQVIRATGANNISWVFHVSADDDPTENWNRLETYYPGDDAVDWVGFSAYGAQSPVDDWTPSSFRESADNVYPRLEALAPDKPIMVLEFGCTSGSPVVTAEAWAQATLNDLFARRWPRIAGFSWWNEKFPNDDNPLHDTNMRLQDSPPLAQVFQNTLTNHAEQIQQRPLVKQITD